MLYERALPGHENRGQKDYCTKEEGEGEYQILSENQEKAKRILLRLHEAGGCSAQDEYDKGWDEAITEAIRIVEEETGTRIEEVLD